MKVYLDYVFIENFIINLSVIYQTSVFTKTKISKSKIVIATIFLSIISVVNKLDIGNNLILQILAINIVIYFVYYPKTIVKHIKYKLYYYFIYTKYVGIIITTSLLFNINLDSVITRILIYLTSIVLTYVITNFMWKIWLNKIKYSDLTYTVNIESMNNISFKTFIDTGNNLKDYSNNLDVIIINSDKYKSKIKRNRIEETRNQVIDILTMTAHGKSNLKGYIYSNVVIKKGGEKKIVLDRVVIVFIDEKIINNNFDGIISYNTYLEKLEGVKL